MGVWGLAWQGFGAGGGGLLSYSNERFIPQLCPREENGARFVHRNPSNTCVEGSHMLSRGARDAQLVPFAPIVNTKKLELTAGQKLL
jgi:hypothetical protein